MLSPPAALPCPTDDALAAFVEGRLDQPERARVVDHVDGCAPCAGVLAAFVRSYPGQVDSCARAIARVQGRRAVEPGTKVGRYVILERVGAGAVGVVYAAHDPQLDRRIAVKLVPSEHQETLSEEARAMAKLAHPNVVTVYDVGAFEQRVFIAMEFVEGDTLRAWLAAERRPLAEILRAFAEAGRGLAAAHAVGLVHRDFKPENVLVGKDGRVRVTDFGLARPALHHTAPAGTPAYMAPEQRQGQVPDARSDQYSFCLALREALDAQPALAVPKRIRKAIARGLGAPRERYATMGDLLGALAEARGRRSAPAVFALALAATSAAAVVAYAYPRSHPGFAAAASAERAASDLTPVVSAGTARTPGDPAATREPAAPTREPAAPTSPPAGSGPTSPPAASAATSPPAAPAARAAVPRGPRRSPTAPLAADGGAAAPAASLDPGSYQ